MQHKSQNKKTITILCVNLVNWPRIKNVLILVIKVIDCVCSETEVSHMWHCLFNKPELKGVWAQKKGKPKRRNSCIKDQSVSISKSGKPRFYCDTKPDRSPPFITLFNLYFGFKKLLTQNLVNEPFYKTICEPRCCIWLAKAPPTDHLRPEIIF